MTEIRLADYLTHIVVAAQDACRFVEGLTAEDFAKDRRTQQAVVMSLMVIGEAASRINERHPEFVEQQPELPWRSMRGMRNRIAHGYFDINLDVVWSTVQKSLPKLLAQLSSLGISATNPSDPC